MKILVRFDDLCSTMKWSTWEKTEEFLIEHNIKPIVAVIPDNRDKDLMIEKKNVNFWQLVRKWQDLNWTIGLHGYQHIFANQNPGIVKLNNYSEFAGISYNEQYTKIAKGIAIFRKNNITPSLWIAPAHSFDMTTIEILKKFNITTISDGFFLKPALYREAFWIPQQVWAMNKIVIPCGVWTVCYHINNWDDKDVGTFRKHILKYKKHIASIDEIVQSYAGRQISLTDKLFNHLWHMKIKCEKLKTILQREK